MLRLHFKDNQQPPFLVTEKSYCIGSASDNQLIINDESVNSLHAKLIAEDNKWFLKDNNSSSGCYINGQRITNKEIFPGDLIKLGKTELIVLDPRKTLESEQHLSPPWRLVSDCSWLPGRTFLIPADRPVIIGRTENCDITIPGTHLSRRHAELNIIGSQLFVRDLGSANGTYLNESRVTEAQVRDGDRLRIDIYSFRVIAPEAEEQKTRFRISTDLLNIPIERKQPSNEPKKWKTRPTSPGNRIEPTTPAPKSAAPWKWFLLGVLLIALAMIGGKYLW